ncbi:hypothetical protein DERF_011563 [Dermatophagoides farinae]|uniref:Uncharacterized protein n=1 Tax=Dermatophagoides farinae TaxID=6954 RepID=A0A922HTB4_DERFA|nr:hypothetical protein DERF_011563 [Dermatophagoides farinae]
MDGNTLTGFKQNNLIILRKFHKTGKKSLTRFLNSKTRLRSIGLRLQSMICSVVNRQVLECASATVFVNNSIGQTNGKFQGKMKIGFLLYRRN